MRLRDVGTQNYQSHHNINLPFNKEISRVFLFALCRRKKDLKD